MIALFAMRPAMCSPCRREGITDGRVYAGSKCFFEAATNLGSSGLASFLASNADLIARTVKTRRTATPAKSPDHVDIIF